MRIRCRPRGEAREDDDGAGLSAAATAARGAPACHLAGSRARLASASTAFAGRRARRRRRRARRRSRRARARDRGRTRRRTRRRPPGREGASVTRTCRGGIARGAESGWGGARGGAREGEGGVGARTRGLVPPRGGARGGNADLAGASVGARRACKYFSSRRRPLNARARRVDRGGRAHFQRTVRFRDSRHSRPRSRPRRGAARWRRATPAAASARGERPEDEAPPAPPAPDPPPDPDSDASPEVNWASVAQRLRYVVPAPPDPSADLDPDAHALITDALSELRALDFVARDPAEVATKLVEHDVLDAVFALLRDAPPPASSDDADPASGDASDDKENAAAAAASTAPDPTPEAPGARAADRDAPREARGGDLPALRALAHLSAPPGPIRPRRRIRAAPRPNRLSHLDPRRGDPSNAVLEAALRRSPPSPSRPRARRPDRADVRREGRGVPGRRGGGSGPRRSNPEETKRRPRFARGARKPLGSRRPAQDAPTERRCSARSEERRPRTRGQRRRRTRTFGRSLKSSKSSTSPDLLAAASAVRRVARRPGRATTATARRGGERGARGVERGPRPLGAR